MGGVLIILDLTLTTDKLGPLTVEDADTSDHTEDDGEPGKGRGKGPTTRNSNKKSLASKTVKQSPGQKSSKKISKVKVQLKKGGKKSAESTQFQEILEEAELIAASINQTEDDDEMAEGVSADVKVERDSSGDDSDENMYGDDDDEEYDDEIDEDQDAEANDDVEQSTSYLEAGAETESTDMSQETSGTTTSSRTAKKRKLAAKAMPLPVESDEACGDTPAKVSSRY